MFSSWECCHIPAFFACICVLYYFSSYVFFLSGCVCILFNSSQNLVVGIPIFLISEFSHIFNIPRVGIKNSNISKFLRDSKSFMMHVSIFWFRDPKALACIINFLNSQDCSTHPRSPTALTQEILEIKIIYDAGQYFLISV